MHEGQKSELYLQFNIFLCAKMCTFSLLHLNWLSKRINIIEYQLPCNFVYYKVFSYLPSLSYNSNIISFLNLMIESNHNRGTELEPIHAFLSRSLLLCNKLSSVRASVYSFYILCCQGHNYSIINYL